MRKDEYGVNVRVHCTYRTYAHIRVIYFDRLSRDDDELERVSNLMGERN